jgi:hypothetical protein
MRYLATESRLTTRSPSFTIILASPLPSGSGRHGKGKNALNCYRKPNMRDATMRLLPSVALVTIACGIAADAIAAPAGDGHPNIVVILADDKY